MNPTETYAVIDIETHTVEERPNPTVDELRYVGIKAFNGKKIMYHHSEKDAILKAIKYFPYLVGHNIYEYDIPILERYGYNFYGKIIIDTMKISINRCKSMMYLDLNQGDLSLSSLAKRFNLTHSKGVYDYNKLKADALVGADLDELKEYLYGDLDTTDDLFKYFYTFFYGFREYISNKDQERMKWLVSPPGGTAYKCICNMAGIPEDYDENATGTNKAYQGGYVSEPYLDMVEV